MVVLPKLAAHRLAVFDAGLADPVVPVTMVTGIMVPTSRPATLAQRRDEDVANAGTEAPRQRGGAADTRCGSELLARLQFVYSTL
jgi:hypothetical protein